MNYTIKNSQNDELMIEKKQIQKSKHIWKIGDRQRVREILYDVIRNQPNWKETEEKTTNTKPQ